MQADDERRALDQVAERLVTRFPGLPAETIVTLVREAHRELAGRPIRAFVPILVEKAVKERLTEAAGIPLADRLIVTAARMEPA
jgi:hypothetical protein